MAKKMQPSSEFSQLEGDKKQNYSTDHISKLLDEIIVSILSLLTMKEAARTSVLSSRWRYLWTSYKGSLDFDESTLMTFIRWGKANTPIAIQRSGFVSWVNHVLEVHQSSTIDEFKVCFDVDEKNFKSEIESWISFSLKKKVKRLTLDFECAWGILPWGHYTLTTQFLHRYSLDSLTTLCLTAVEVTELVLVHVLSNCPFLEVLHVEASKSLVNLKLASPLLKLKRIEILRCISLENIEISAMNLVSFKYWGQKTRILLEGVPNLVDLSIAGHYACFLVNHCRQFSSYFSQLETLELDLRVQKYVRLPKFPKLINLRQLKLILDPKDVDSLLRCTSLLKASPFLYKFALRLLWLNGAAKGKMRVRKAKHPHQCLKVVELIGFIGCTVDMELSLYVLNNTACLEKLIIDTRSGMAEEIRWDSKDPMEKLASMTCARQLETRLPHGVELVIL